MTLSVLPNTKRLPEPSVVSTAMQWLRYFRNIEYRFFCAGVECEPCP